MYSSSCFCSSFFFFSTSRWRFLNDLPLNVKNTYVFTFFFWAARSILFQQVLSGYVYVLTQSNQPVGIVKGIQGISQLMFSIPAAHFADKNRRDEILKISGALGLIASCLTLIAIQNNHIFLLYACFGMWGLFSAFQNPALEALFADSIPNGKRSFPFMIKYTLSNLAMICGPLISVLLFSFYGNVWHVPELRAVLAFGAFLAAIASICLFRFNDDLAYENCLVKKQIEEEQQGLCTPSYVGSELELQQDFDSDSDVDLDHTKPSSTSKSIEMISTMSKSDISTEKTQLLSTPGDGTMTTGNHPIHTDLEEAIQNVVPVPVVQVPVPVVEFLCFQQKDIPFLLFISDFIISNGAGMTINFFPLFFMKEYGLSPIQVNILFLCQPIVVMLLSVMSQQSSKWLGRMPIIVTTRIFATLCLLLMSFTKPIHLQILLFLLRGGTMRCSQPLRRSLLMDHVPKEYRARWNALENVAVFSWSGSAVLGGYLIDRFDYRSCFFITSIVYFFGVFMELLLIPLTRHAVEH